MRTSSAILTGLSLLLSPIAGAADTSIGEGEASEDITDYRLEDLLNVDASGGGKGSFGYRLDQLDQLGVTPYLHAYSVFDAEFEQDAPTSFDQHYFNVFVGADIQDLIVAETQLEYEHGGDEIQMRFGQVDIRTPSELITFRLGKFLVPMGRYNTHTYPEFLSKLPDRPMVLREIVPVS